MATEKPLERRLGMAELNQRLNVLESGHSLICDQIAELTVEQKEQTQRIEEACRRGVEAGLESFVEKLQARAAEHTGRWLWSTLKAALTRWLVIALVVVVVGKYLGWPAASAIVDAITGVKK